MPFLLTYVFGEPLGPVIEWGLNRDLTHLTKYANAHGRVSFYSKDIQRNVKQQCTNLAGPQQSRAD